MSGEKTVRRIVTPATGQTSDRINLTSQVTTNHIITTTPQESMNVWVSEEKIHFVSSVPKLNI